MPVRLGIELSPATCRIIELDSAPRTRAAPSTRVRSFSRLPRESAETQRKLATLQRQPAAVVAWGLQADYRQAVVQRGSFRWVRREAVAMMHGTGVPTRGRVADMFVGPRARGATTRSVVVALASTSGLVAILRSLDASGVKVQAIGTPALALMSLARLRRESASSEGIDVYVALEETATAVALIRKGLLLAATELDWGYQDENGFTWTRDEIAGHLGGEIERFLLVYDIRRSAVEQVCICGGLPELRSMAVRLMEHLDMEVETLDSLFGIDVARLADADEFREHAAEVRLAWAAAADWPPPLNLLRERDRQRTKTMLSRAAVAAGVITGVGAAWQVARSDWWRSAPPAAPASARTVAPPQRSPQDVPTPLASLRPEADVRLPPAAPSPGPAVAAPPVVQPPVVPPAATPTVPPLPPRAPIPEPRVTETRIAEAPRPQPLVARPPALSAPPPERVPVSERRRVVTEPEVPLPFDAALGTILYAPERKLAIVDGRIVQAGDEVNGAQIVDITPTAVLLRDTRGRLRRLGLDAPAP